VSFEIDAKNKGYPRLLLSAAVGVRKSFSDASYNIPQLVK
jgi:hypothetical protein